ncbi:hypothetical protein PoB_003216700 [Plakobranchus ocellatus]|uniref:Uncharacterized protein n=1 Tax=Plakobranchus ocellatus TaxID=259542 RepID=A0AAV4AEJ9_9GAST|nr:hypothetical protein PoB_003216700 [Plakobranchus ocellatus]
MAAKPQGKVTTILLPCHPHPWLMPYHTRCSLLQTCRQTCHLVLLDDIASMVPTADSSPPLKLPKSFLPVMRTRKQDGAPQACSQSGSAILQVIKSVT